MKMPLPGVDVILDNIGGSYLQRNLNSLAVDGRLFIIGFMGGVVTEVNLGIMLARRLTIQGWMILSIGNPVSFRFMILIMPFLCLQSYASVCILRHCGM
jgi:NADPH:quinone reductase-like Zn-dependent oxidoreductase